MHHPHLELPGNEEPSELIGNGDEECDGEVEVVEDVYRCHGFTFFLQKSSNV